MVEGPFVRGVCRGRGGTEGEGEGDGTPAGLCGGGVSVLLDSTVTALGGGVRWGHWEGGVT